MFNWFRSLFAPPPSAPAVRPPRFCPALEGLGDRVVPAAGAVAELVREAAAVEAVTTLLRSERADETDAPTITVGARFTEIAATVPESTREAVRQARAETQDRLGEVVLAGRVAVRLVEVVRAAPVDIKWSAVQRFWLESRAFGPPGAPGHLLAAPPLSEVHLTGPASDARVPHSPVPAFHPHTTDPQAAVPRAQIEFWSITVSDESEPPERPGPPITPPAAPTGTPQPVESADQESAAPAVVSRPDGDGVVRRFLPFDTADLRKGVSDFLCGLEPVLPGLPEQVFGEWELGAALVVGTGVVLAVGKRGTRTRAGERRPSAVSVFESLPTRVQ